MREYVNGRTIFMLLRRQEYSKNRKMTQCAGGDTERERKKKARVGKKKIICLKERNDLETMMKEVLTSF